MTIFVNNEELLRRFRAGETQALCEVYSRYVAAVKTALNCCARTLRVQVGGRLDVADIVQDVFIKAFSERARLSYDARFGYKPFLLAVARNAFIDELRRQSREIHLDETHVDCSALAEIAPDEQVPWADPQLTTLVARHLAELNVQERAIYYERYVRDRSQEQTATALARQQVRTLESRLCVGLARRLGVERGPSSGQMFPSVRGRSRTFADGRGDPRSR